MKYQALILVLSLFVWVRPVMAGMGLDEMNNNAKGEDKGKLLGATQREVESTESANHRRNVKITLVCETKQQWLNHGGYVTCIARLHLEGATTSAAAKSEIGKRERAELATYSSVKSETKNSKQAYKLGKEDKVKEATKAANVKAFKRENLITRLESLIERLNHIIQSLKLIHQ